MTDPKESRDPSPRETRAADSGPDRTSDGRYVVVDGRRWRACDPAIPEALRSELTSELMRARRLVKTDPAHARPRVHDAKVALGERGDPWWAPTAAGRRERAAAAIRTLLRQRDGATICPSDAARVVGGEAWRSLMPLVREVAAGLAAAGAVRVMQKGKPVDALAARGPLRLAPGPALSGPVGRDGPAAGGGA